MKKIKYKTTIAIISVALMSFLGILTETSLNVTYPAMMKQFEIGLNTVQWATTGYLLTIAIVMVTSSFFNRRVVTRKLFITAVLGFSLGSLISGVGPSFGWVLLGRILSTTGAGISTPLMFNLIVEIMPQEKWGSYMGIAGLVIVLAPTLGPTFGGLVSYYLNWQYIFIIALIFAIVVLIAGLLVLENYHDAEKVKFDLIGFMILALAFISLTLAVNQLSQGFAHWESWLYFVVSVFCFIAFVRHESKVAIPLINLEVFANHPFTLGLVAYFLLQFINIGTSFVLPNYIQIVNQQSSLVSGLLLLPGSIISALMNPCFGRMYDRFGGKLPLFCGASMMLLGTLCFTLLGLKLTVWMIIVFYAFLTFGHKMAFSNTMAEMLKRQNDQLKSDATAVGQTAQQLAGSLGTAILAAIISINQVNASNYRLATAKGSQLAFALTVGLLIIIIFCYIKLFNYNIHKKVGK